MPNAPDNLTDQERRLWEAEARLRWGKVWEADCSQPMFIGETIGVSRKEGDKLTPLFEIGRDSADGGRDNKAAAEFIALSRNAVRPLLEEVARLQGALEQIAAGLMRITAL